MRAGNKIGFGEPSLASDKVTINDNSQSSIDEQSECKNGSFLCSNYLLCLIWSALSAFVSYIKLTLLIMFCEGNLLFYKMLYDIENMHKMITRNYYFCCKHDFRKHFCQRLVILSCF